MPIINKPWGYEDLLEVNDHYVLKRLFMKGGECCSLQYHEKKHETIFVLTGTLVVMYGDSVDKLETIELNNYYLVIPPLKIHRMYGITDCIYLEVSTPELDDVVRLQDMYGRSE